MDMFVLAAVVTPLMLLATAGIVTCIAVWQDNRDMRLARERGEFASKS